jgi:maleate isomerase
LATPYSDALGTRLVDYVRGAGFQVVASVNLGVESIAGISNLSADEIETLAAKAVTPDTDVLFISCTALSTFSLIPQLEARFRIPVITANQVTMWAAMRAASIPATLSGQMLFDKTASRLR